MLQVVFLEKSEGQCVWGGGGAKNRQTVKMMFSNIYWPNFAPASCGYWEMPSTVFESLLAPSLPSRPPSSQQYVRK
jgi:hypothetical protein